MSDIETTFWSHFDTSRVQVFGINDGEGYTVAQNFVRNFGLTYPILLDQNGIVNNLYPMYGITPYPRDVIMDQNGMISYMHTEYDPQYMLQTVNSLLQVNSLSDKTAGSLPKDLQLEVFPNPFNPTTTVSLRIIEAATVKLDIYNILGQQIQSLEFTEFTIGSKVSIPVELNNYPTGVYFLTVTNGSLSKSHKLLLLQ